MLSKQDANHLLEIIQKSLGCVSEDEFRALVDNLKNLIPYAHATCLMAETDQQGGIVSYEVVNVSYPPEWVAHYVEQNLELIDPIVCQHFKQYQLQYWEDTYWQSDSSEEFKHAAEAFGLRQGYSCGQQNIAGRRGSLFSFAGEHLRRDQRTEVILWHMVPHLHQALSRVVKWSGSARSKRVPVLTPKEREVLKWLIHGKSTWEISCILSSSQDTIRFHIKNLFRKLDVANRAHAVAVALDLGLLDTE
jgi:DNA-binding CsgD family transcriptional regulator